MSRYIATRAIRGANAIVAIDLERQTITGPDGGLVHFEIEPFRKHCLINGLDDIGLTQQKMPKVKSYEQKAAAERPWA